jgi:hypothetical protein
MRDENAQARGLVERVARELNEIAASVEASTPR